MAIKLNAGDVTRKDMLMVDPYQIVVKEELRGRWMAPPDSAIVAMAESMVENTQLEPVQCRKIEGDKLLLTMGFTRTAASRMIRDGFTNSAGEKIQDPDFKLKVLLVSGNDQVAFVNNVVENAIRNETSHVDNAFNQNRLRENHGMTNDQIANLYKWKGTVKVCQLQRLLNAEQPILEAVHNGKMGLEAALLLLDLPADERAKTMENATTEAGKINGADIKTQVREHHLRDQDSNHAGSNEVIAPKRITITMKELKLFMQSQIDEFAAEAASAAESNKENAAEAAEAAKLASKFYDAFLGFVNGTRQPATVKKNFKALMNK